MSAPNAEGDFQLVIPQDVLATLPSSTPPVEEPLSEFATGVLKDIPEQDRATVAKYLKTWDGNVTKQFQKIHQEYEPYKQFGTVEDISQNLKMIELLNEDPVAFIQFVQDALKEVEMSYDEPENVPVPVQQQNVLPEWEGVPQPVVEKMQNLEKMLTTLTEQVSSTQNHLTEKDQLAQLDNLMKGLHTTHGDFPDDYVLMEMSRGVPPEDAVKKVLENLQKYGSSPRKPPPVLLGPGGATPSNQVDVSKLDAAGRKAMMVASLNAANNG